MTATIGGTLKDARTKQSLSLEDVHAKLKIHPRVLQLLEDDKFEKLPSPLFVKSFLKSYAEFLNVDPKGLLQSYEKTERKEPEQSIFIRPAEYRDTPAAIDKKFLLIPAAALGIVVAGAALFFGVRAATELIPKLKLPARAPAARAAARKPSEPAKPARQEAVRADADTWLRSAEQGNFPAIKKSVPLELKVTGVDNVWLRVTCDGKIAFQSILKRGTSGSWQAKETIEIWTGNSSNMALSLNGTSLGSPGKGVVKKLQISHRGVKIAA
ncbi:MAG TPA: RodZ domain-containing protein [Candidatus Eisenbacteria bacterium]|nr:RodZ domain-containing protein [Candidatus Eisenbacteria bacterium]